MIQVLQNRKYGAERYIRLLVGWEVAGFVIDGMDVIKQKPHESKMATIARMLECSQRRKESQPLLILRKLENMTFNDVMLEGNWSVDKATF